MTASAPKSRDLLGVFRFAAGVWLGVSLFFTFGVAKSLFSRYESEVAGGIIEGIFPAYYQFLYFAGALMALAVALGASALPRWKPVLILVLFAVVFIGTIDFKISPVMNQLSLPEERPQFMRLHGLGMVLNLAAMLATGIAAGLARRGGGEGERESEGDGEG